MFCCFILPPFRAWGIFGGDDMQRCRVVLTHSLARVDLETRSSVSSAACVAPSAAATIFFPLTGGATLRVAPQALIFSSRSKLNGGKCAMHVSSAAGHQHRSRAAPRTSLCNVPHHSQTWVLITSQNTIFRSLKVGVASEACVSSAEAPRSE